MAVQISFKDVVTVLIQRLEYSGIIIVQGSSYDAEAIYIVNVALSFGCVLVPSFQMRRKAL